MKKKIEHDKMSGTHNKLVVVIKELTNVIRNIVAFEISVYSHFVWKETRETKNWTLFNLYISNSFYKIHPLGFRWILKHLLALIGYQDLHIWLRWGNCRPSAGKSKYATSWLRRTRPIHLSRCYWVVTPINCCIYIYIYIGWISSSISD
jgi:hypothetical protein